MTFPELLTLAAPLPIIESASLRVSGEEPRALSVQLSRWVRSGKLLQLRRGKYLLAEPYRRSTPPLDYLANLLVTPSYVSLERALAHHGMIPERVPLVQSVTTGRPATFHTALGDFEYRNVKRDWFFGYREMKLAGGSALVALPEKALLDLVHLSPGVLSLESLRLQDLERLDLSRLQSMAEGHGARFENAAAKLTGWLKELR